MEDRKWYAEDLETIGDEYDLNYGLSEEEVKSQRQKYGENKLDEAKGRSFLARLLDQFKDVTIIILIVAALISAFTGNRVDAIIILAIVVLNAVIGLAQEDKAEKSLKALQDMSSPSAKVIRDGVETSINAKDVVVGDILVLEAGDLVAADIRVINSNSLQVQESSLTGESVPVHKEADIVLDEDAVLGDRKNMAYSSGTVTYGRGRGLVVSTGMDTEVGKIATMLQETQTDLTPLQKQLNHLGKVLGIGALIACGIILAIGVYHQNFMDMFLTAVHLR